MFKIIKPYNLIFNKKKKKNNYDKQKIIKNKNQLMNELKEIDQISGYVETNPKNKVKKFHLEARLKEHYMSGQGFSPKQLEQLGLVMDSKIEPINQRLTNIENRLDHLEQDVKILKNDVSQINQRLDKIESCPTIQKEMINK